MRTIWRIIGVKGRIIIGLFILLVCAVLFLPLLSSLPIEFKDLSGDQAESRLRRYFPEDVPLNDVQKVNGKIYSQIDCHSRWFRITLLPEAAQKWQDVIHAKLETSSRIGLGVEFIEGVHRTVNTAAGPIVTETEYVKPPKWWVPHRRSTFE